MFNLEKLVCNCNKYYESLFYGTLTLGILTFANRDGITSKDVAPFIIAGSSAIISALFYFKSRAMQTYVKIKIEEEGFSSELYKGQLARFAKIYAKENNLLEEYDFGYKLTKAHLN